MIAEIFREDRLWLGKLTKKIGMTPQRRKRIGVHLGGSILLVSAIILVCLLALKPGQIGDEKRPGQLHQTDRPHVLNQSSSVGHYDKTVGTLVTSGTEDIGTFTSPLSTSTLVIENTSTDTGAPSQQVPDGVSRIASTTVGTPAAAVSGKENPSKETPILEAPSKVPGIPNVVASNPNSTGKGSSSSHSASHIQETKEERVMKRQVSPEQPASPEQPETPQQPATHEELVSPEQPATSVTNRPWEFKDVEELLQHMGALHASEEERASILESVNQCNSVAQESPIAEIMDSNVQEPASWLKSVPGMREVAALPKRVESYVCKVIENALINAVESTFDRYGESPEFPDRLIESLTTVYSAIESSYSVLDRVIAWLKSWESVTKRIFG